MTNSQPMISAIESLLLESVNTNICTTEEMRLLLSLLSRDLSEGERTLLRNGFFSMTTLRQVGHLIGLATDLCGPPLQAEGPK